MKMNGNKNRTVILLAVLMLITAASLAVFSAGCENPLKEIIARDLGLPDISVFLGETEVPNGGSVDAFFGAEQDIPKDVEFTVTNTGTTNLILREKDPIDFSGDHATLFSVHTPPEKMSIASGGSTTFTARLVMDSPGDKIANIDIYSNDPDENPYSFTASNVAFPEIQVLQGSVEIPGGTGSYDFGEQEYGGFVDVEFTIKNLGTADLELTGDTPLTITGEKFSVRSQPSSPIAKNESTTFTVRFDKSDPGTYSETLSISNSDEDEDPYTFYMKGKLVLPMTEQFYSCGGHHTVALKSDGTVWAWGFNDYGQLGDGTTDFRHTPVEVSGLSGVIAVEAGEDYTAALKSNGTVWTWGSNQWGELGTGSTDMDPHPTPVQVNGISDVAAIDSASFHTAVLKSDGTVWAWGTNGDGRLGDGTTEDRFTPTRVGGLSNVTAIACGTYHTVALKTDGTVRAWGSNQYGQLGDGTSGNERHAPVPVSELSDVTAIAAGSGHTVALKSDGTVWAWGWNSNGQIGDGTSGNEWHTPVQVKGLDGVGWLTDIKAIACGSHHTAALKTDGTVWAWGSNTSGKLGDGTTVERTTPVQVKEVDGVGSLMDVTAITCGSHHMGALKTDGAVYSWGRNIGGRLGDGTTDDRYTPVKISILAEITAVACGENHNGALKNVGTVRTWGLNSNGQLGDGTTDDRNSPVQVNSLADVTAIACGDIHTIALKTGGTVLAWGGNNYGQLGDGSTDGRHTPVQVTGLLEMTAIAGGGSHTVALKNDETVWAWGGNNYGQLGDGTKVDRHTPLQVDDLLGMTAIACGDKHTVALKNGGTVWAWGSNSFGQLGDNSETERLTPVKVKNTDGSGDLTDITAIAAGYSHTVALKSDGTVYAWGNNDYGQLGLGHVVDMDTPQKVKGVGGVDYLSDITAIACGLYHTIALKSDGTVYAWGDNFHGQLGDGTSKNERDTPVQVKDVGGSGVLTEVAAVAGGYNHTVAMNTDGKVWAWGRNSSGQLGDGTLDERITPVIVSEFLILW